MDFAIKYLSDPVCPAFGPVRSRVCPFSYMLYILLQKDFYYNADSILCQVTFQRNSVSPVFKNCYFFSSKPICRYQFLTTATLSSSGNEISYGFRFK